MPHPISLTLSDDLERNRLTVLVRLILVIPHLIWLSLWGIVVFFAVIISWFATLFAGTTPIGLHNFIAQYLRYGVQVYGYLLFLADPYPASWATGPTPPTWWSRRRSRRTAGRPASEASS